MKNLYNTDDWKDMSYCRLGEILLDAGKINLMHVSMVLDVQRFKKIPMGEVLVSMNIISREELDQALLIQQTIQKRSDNGEKA